MFRLQTAYNITRLAN